MFLQMMKSLMILICKQRKFDVDVRVGEDGSYTVTENIKVKFVNPRHGIYRYISYKGKVITSDKNGDQKKTTLLCGFYTVIK